MCLKLCLTILFVLCCCCGKGQNEVAVENDSILMAYYKKCKANLDSPIALDMCDTLFVRSEKAGNRAQFENLGELVKNTIFVA